MKQNPPQRTAEASDECNKAKNQLSYVLYPHTAHTDASKHKGPVFFSGVNNIYISTECSFTHNVLNQIKTHETLEQQKDMTHTQKMCAFVSDM